MQMGIQISSFGLLGLLLLILWIMTRYLPEKSRLISLFVPYYMRHVYILMVFVASGFLVYRLGIDYLKVSADNAYLAGTALFGALTAGYMG